MNHLDVVLDMGFDYGSQGGPDDFGVEIVKVYSGREFRNIPRTRELGQWQLGNRNIDLARLNQLIRFWNSVRGSGVSWLYKDWNDYSVSAQALAIDGGASAQLIKTFDGFGNDYTRDIVKPKVDSWTFTLNGSPLTVADIDAATGLVTFNTPYPAPSDVVLATGEFYKPARFDTPRFSPQFLAWEERDNGVRQAIYSLPSLVVAEVLL